MVEQCVGAVLNPPKTFPPKSLSFNQFCPIPFSSSSCKMIPRKPKIAMNSSSSSTMSSSYNLPSLSLEALKTSERRREIMDAIERSFDNCLSETHLDLTVPGLKSKTRGKVTSFSHFFFVFALLILLFMVIPQSSSFLF